MEAPKTSRRIDPGDLAELGRLVDFPAMLQGFGVAVRRQGANLVCAIRKERTPSCQIYAPGQGRMGHKGWTYWDFGSSDDGGDVFDYLRKHQGMEFLDAVRYVAELTGYRPAGLGEDRGRASKPRPKPTPMPAKIETPSMPPEEQAEACRIYLEALCEVEPMSEIAGAAYLGPNPAHKGRNVTPKGWPSIAYAQFPENQDALTEALMPHSDLLIRAGLMKGADDNGPVRLQWGKRWKTLIWLAHHDEKGNVAGLVARRFEWADGDSQKYLYQRGDMGARRVLFGLPMLYRPSWLAWQPAPEHAGDLLIVEGQLDALGAACLGRSALALGGRVQASGAKDTHSRTATMLQPHLSALRDMKRILVLPDNDADKSKAAQGVALAGKLVAMLNAEGCRAEITALDKIGIAIKQGCKDLADVAAVREPA